jgi:uncharacterized protein YndB with AHSA1/START domain
MATSWERNRWVAYHDSGSGNDVQPGSCERSGLVKQVERQIVLPVPPSRVWAALSDPEQLSAWFGAKASIELRPRGRARFRWPDGTERAAVVETVDEPRLLVFRWLPFERADRGAARLTGAGRVRISLQPRDGGTLLTVVETGMPAGLDHPRDPGPLSATPPIRGRPPPAPEIRAAMR